MIVSSCIQSCEIISHVKKLFTISQGDMAGLMLPQLSTSLSSYDNTQRLSYTNNELRLPSLSETSRGRPLSGVYALQMEQSGYLELRKYINEKRNHSLFRVINCVTVGYLGLVMPSVAVVQFAFME